MFCIVTVLRVHVLNCDSGTCTCVVLTAVCVHVLCCDSGMPEKNFEQPCLRVLAVLCLSTSNNIQTTGLFA
jgi:hypothetical protein